MPADLTPFPITPKSGVVKTEANRIVEGRWTDSDKIRAVRGVPQKVGGNVLAFPAATSGVPRALHAWRDVNFNQYLAAGTYRKLYVYDTGGAQNDITPFRRGPLTLGANPFTSFIGSNIVQVTDPANGAGAGDTVIISGATTFNGVTPNGTFIVQMVNDPNNYTIQVGTTATNNGTGGGGAVVITYEINVGVETGAFGYGWGVGPWGMGTWGTPRPSSTISIEPRVWSLDHFGKFLVATYNTGTLYQFDPTQAQPWPRAIVMSSDPALPTDARALFVTPEEFVFALRSNMQVSWCSQGDFTTWTPATNNTANSRTLAVGTKLVGGCVLGPFVSLVLTDAACYKFQYDGSAFIYSSALVARNCGLIGPGALVSVGGMAFWMGPDNFWMFNGGSVVPIPNVEDIRRYVFGPMQGINTLTQGVSYQCAAIYNPIFNEIDFYYPTMTSVAPDHYVKLMLDDYSWWPGTGTRASGTHFDQGDTRPYLGDATGFIYQHENTNDANGVPLPWTLTLGRYALQEGLYGTELESIIMDFFQQSGNIAIQFDCFDRLMDPTPMDTDTEVYGPTDGLIDLNISGRYIGITMSCSDAGSYMRFGKPTVFIKQGGARP